VIVMSKCDHNKHRYLCNDCGIDTVAAGEFYRLRPEIWSGQLGLGERDNLCIGCLEKRLGRKITLRDLGGFPHYPWMKPLSLRLLHRMHGQRITKRPPYRLLRGGAAGGLSKATVQTIGEYGAQEAARSALGRV
jgi:hypothetical protein